MWQTIGQEKIVWFLKRCIRENGFSQAYLFLGPEGVGKGTLARDFAAALNCPSNDPPCDSCSSCRRIRSDIHPDVQVMGLPSDRKEIGIDQIREIISAAYLPPYEGRYKVFIIDGVQNLSPEAGNCLLKTLEEPPSKVVFLLLALEEKDLLPTIVSRCHLLYLTLLSQDTVRDFLKKRGLPPQRAELLARLCGGCLGKATEGFLEQRKSWLRDLRRLFSGARFSLAEELTSHWDRDRKGVLEELSFWRYWWHDLLLLKVGLRHLISNFDLIEELDELGRHLSLGEIEAGLKAVEESSQYLKLNAHPRLVFYTLMLSLP